MAPALAAFMQEFEIDYVSLSYTNSARDVYECRALLDSIAMSQTKIVAKVGVCGEACLNPRREAPC